LRFELRSRVGEEEFERYIAWRAGDEIRTWWGRPDAPRPPSLQSALDRAELTSGGSIHAIPSLLLPELRPGALSDLTDLQLLEDAWIGDVLCHRVTGTRRAEPLRSMCLWIDAESRLIRRIEQPGELGDLRTRTTDYTPEIDIPIDSAAIAFDPPEEAR
jgi:hypothetical protein